MLVVFTLTSNFPNAFAQLFIRLCLHWKNNIILKNQKIKRTVIVSRFIFYLTNWIRTNVLDFFFFGPKLLKFIINFTVLRFFIFFVCTSTCAGQVSLFRVTFTEKLLCNLQSLNRFDTQLHFVHKPQVYKAIEDKTNSIPQLLKKWSIGPLTGLSCIFLYDSINIDYSDDSSVGWKGYYPWINFL